MITLISNAQLPDAVYTTLSQTESSSLIPVSKVCVEEIPVPLYVYNKKEGSSCWGDALSWCGFNGNTCFVEIYNSFGKCLKKKDVAYDQQIKEVASSLVSAFSSQSVSDYSVDYGRKYKALILYLTVNGCWEFRVRCEVGDTSDKLVVFSIMKDKTEVYTGTDSLKDFKLHVDQFCAEVNQFIQPTAYNEYRLSNSYFA